MTTQVYQEIIAVKEQRFVLPGRHTAVKWYNLALVAGAGSAAGRSPLGAGGALTKLVPRSACIKIWMWYIDIASIFIVPWQDRTRHQNDNETTVCA